MKKNYYFTAARLMMAVALAAGFTACSNENENGGIDTNKKGEPITITAQINAPAGTRTTVAPSSDGTASVKWAAGDAFELFGDADHQTFSLAQGGEGGSNANFTGTAVGVSATYHAFYPATKALKAGGQAANTFNEIVLSVDGQAQTSENNASHLGVYSYMTASNSTQDNFSFAHLMTMLSLNITLPEAATPTSLDISTPDGNLLYSSMNADGGNKTATNKQTLALSGMTGVTTFKAHLMMIPFALANQKMVITVNCEGGKKYAITKANVTMTYTAGLRYTATVTLAGAAATFLFDASVAASQGEDYSSGSGTASDPYIISNAKQLRKLVLTTSSTDCFQLATDIEVRSDISWTPIEDFEGTFDGNGHKITGTLNGTNSDGEMGVFADLYGAIIKNLTVEADVTNTGQEDYAITGGIAARDYDNVNTIINCTVRGTVTGGNKELNYTGGIIGYVGQTTSQIINCHFDGTMVGYSDCTGGMAGLNKGKVYKCCTNNDTSGYSIVGERWNTKDPIDCQGESDSHPHN